MSTTERDKCGFSSLLPMSCRERAESFARHLHSRLRSLDSENDGSSADESSWLAAHEASVAVSHQPRHTSESDMYFNFGLLESPGSPEEEVIESELSTLINNKDNLDIARCENCSCPKNPNLTSHTNAIITNSHDSDSSDGPYYDTESETYQKTANTYVNGIAELPELPEDEQDIAGKKLVKIIENHVHESPPMQTSPVENHVGDYINDSSYESPVTSELTGPAQSCNEEESTLSLRDEDLPSLEYSSTFQDLPQIENQEAAVEQTLDNTEEPPTTFPEVSNETPICCLDRVENPETETYSSSLNIEKDFTVECPLTNVQITKCDTLEKEDDSPKESRAFLEVGCSNLTKHKEYDHDDDDEAEKETRIPRVRRCSSLKTGKTPPGTPGRKKIVRFADVLGLDLADVRTFLDEIPKVPTSAYDDLVDADLSTSASDSSSFSSSFPKFHPSASHKPEKILFPLFQQPGGQPNFLDKVREKNVCLENAVVNDPTDLSVKGTVRVRNLDFHKSVHIRYSLDAWKSHADLQATYVKNSCDGFSDTFSFLLYAHTLTEGQKLEFAVRFQCKGCQYWDSNHGANYCFQCLPASNNTAYMSNGNYDDRWCGSFY